MSTTTIRISRTAHDRLIALSRASGQPLVSTVEDAIEALLAQRFAQETARGFEQLAADPHEWASYIADLNLPASHDLPE
jgi:predicted DNA-binding protein